MLNNFKKRKNTHDNRPKYLRYDDVFMTQNEPSDNNYKSKNYNNPEKERFYNNNNPYRSEEYEDFYEDEENSINRNNYQSSDENLFLSRNNNNIINDRMVKYQKRKLPPLQRYGAYGTNNPKNMYYNQNNGFYLDDEDDDYDYRSRNYKNKTNFNSIFQKFIITFASMLSLVCISWMIYSWSDNDKNSVTKDMGPLIIEPEQPSFKVFPDASLRNRNVSHQDKTVYSKVDSRLDYSDLDEALLPPQEESKYINSQQSNVEEYSIIDEKTYYIKISAGKSKDILEKESKLLKKKLSSVLKEKTCSVRKVSNSQGQQSYAILIGPFFSQDSALNVAQSFGSQCYIISVKE